LKFGDFASEADRVQRCLCAAAASRVPRAPAFPVPSDFLGARKSHASPGRFASLEREGASIAAIARSGATKQSILLLRGEMDCFSSLAMTELGVDLKFKSEIVRTDENGGRTRDRTLDLSRVKGTLSR
jgi:hypothetical protein